MSKPLQIQILQEIENENKFIEPFMQILSLLEVLKSKKDKNMAKISSELSTILSDEKNLNRVKKAKNLEDLLSILENFKLSKMLKIYDLDTLKIQFPTLAKQNFLK